MSKAIVADKPIVTGRVTGTGVGAVILCCFFLSGASGLIYQVVWTRLLELLFGATTYAVSAVLTAFMGGLALGSMLGGKFADRTRRPLFAYGVMELGIGAYALAFPALFSLLHVLYRGAGPMLEGAFAVSILCRFALAVLTLLVPTTLMGATLPLLSRFVTAEVARIGVSVGRLYGINTVGAVAGVIASGFILLPAVGQHKTILIAAVINLALGVICCFLGRESDSLALPEDGDGSARDRVVVAEPEADIRRRVTGALLVAFASGFAALLYEVCWTRVLVMVLGGSVYAFSTMLATFLIGLSLGALLISSEVDRWGKAGSYWLMVLQTVTGVAVLVTGFLFEKLPYAFMVMFHNLPKSRLMNYLDKSLGIEALEVTNLLIRFLLSAAVMLPAALLIGGTFPAVLRLCARDMSKLGRSIGTVYSINTLGAILGSFGAGFILIPWLGLQKTLFVGVFANLVSGMIAGLTGRSWKSGWTPASAGLVAAAGLVLLLRQIPEWNQKLIASGVYFYAIYLEDDSNPREAVNDRLTNYDMLHYREGAVTTVTVERYKPTGHLLLSNNGKIDASSHVDMPTQELVAHIPLLWYACARGQTAPRAPEKVALIGLASGVTAGSVLQHQVKRVDNIEIEPSMPQATVYFNHLNHRPLDDPRLKLHLNDARDFLTLSREKFDVIIAEPSNPWLSGVANLFTEDCFKIGKAALKDDGIYCQWIQFYSLKTRDVKVLVRTFARVFPYVYVFGVPPNIGETYPGPDLIVLGSKRRLRLDVGQLATAIRPKPIADDLRRIGVTNAGELVGLLRMGEQEVHRYAGRRGRINTDDNAYIEYAAPRSLYDETYDSNYDEIGRHQTDPTRYLASLGKTEREVKELLLMLAIDMNRWNQPVLAQEFRKRAREMR